MNKHLARAIAALLLPTSAHASGFDAPWWFDLAFFLLATPAGWAACAAALVAAIAAIVSAVRRRQRAKQEAPR